MVMERLGLIGAYDHKRLSGFHTPTANKALQDAKSKFSLYSYDNIFNALTAGGNEQGFDVSRDGMRLYVVVPGARLLAKITQYNLSVPWDLSTIAYSGNALIIGDYDISPSYVSISDDGTRLYFSGTTSDTVWSATLATPYDLATATVDVKKFYLGTQDATVSSPRFLSGTTLWVMGGTNDRIYQYNLSTPWDVSTASFVNQSASLTTKEATPTGLFVSENYAYVIGATSDSMHQFTITNPYDVTSLDAGVTLFSVAAEEATPRDVYILRVDGVYPNDRNYFVIGQTGDDINKYFSAGFLQSSASLGEATPTGLWFKPDGTKLYIVGTTNDAVRQFNLSMAWDLSTITFEKSLAVGFDATPSGVTLSDDGTNLYITGTANDCIYQIPLRTPWDIGTASGFVSVGAAESALRSIEIALNGTLLYIAGDGGNAIRKYTLSIPYEVGSATLSQSFTINGVLGIDVSEDGRQIVATTRDTSNLSPGGGRQLRSISMTSPHDLSTAVLNATDWIPLYGLTGANATPWGVRVSNDRTRMFVVSDIVNGIYQFSLRFA